MECIVPLSVYRLGKIRSKYLIIDILSYTHVNEVAKYTLSLLSHSFRRLLIFNLAIINYQIDSKAAILKVGEVNSYFNLPLLPPDAF